MRAVVHDRYGAPHVLRVEEVERPVPQADEVLVRVRAATVSRTDCGFRSGVPFAMRLFTGLGGPKRRILGSDWAGEVEACGAAVTEFAGGDHVFGTRGFGGHAEFICVRESGRTAHMPTGATFEEAAAVCDGGLKALAALRRADLREGQRIVVYGASGAIGTAAVQLAKHFGADVTAVCDTRNLELARALGADAVVDYLQDDFTKNGETYDVVFDAVGKHSFRRCRGSLARRGTYVATDGLENLALGVWTACVGEKRVLFAMASATKSDVLFLKELIEKGKYRAVVDRSYPLEAVVEATRYVETGEKTGNVVLSLAGDRAG